MFNLKLFGHQNWNPIKQGFLTVLLSIFIIVIGICFKKSPQTIWNLSLAPILLFGFLNPVCFIFFSNQKKYIPLSVLIFFGLLIVNYSFGIFFTDNFKDNYMANMLIYQLFVVFFMLIYIIAGLFKGIVYILENN